MIALGTLKPHLTPEFLTAFRALGKQVGYRNLGRAIAYTKLDATSLGRTPSIAGNGDGSKPAANNETCEETAERILGEIGGQWEETTRRVHNFRINIGAECPCGDTKLQFPEIEFHGLRARASTRPMYSHGKKKRYHPMCCQLATEQGIPGFMAHLDTHFWRWPSMLRRTTWRESASDQDLVAARCRHVAHNLPERKCCRRKMGLTPDYTDAHHWRYQCQKKPDHCQDIMITIGPS